MFYVKDKVVSYPSKSILEDVLSRDGYPDATSFSPFKGCAKLMREQFPFKLDEINITPMDIVNASKDFSVHKAKATDDGVKRELRANEIDDYYTRLEDIDDSFIEKYALEAIIGFKRNASGQRKLMKENQSVQKLYDEEDEDFVDISDLTEIERSFSTEDIIEAKCKLPYLLKQLHMGSIYYKGSLLSFIIAAEKFFATSKGEELRPRNIVQYGVYRVNSLGNCIGEFHIEDNSGEIFRRLFKWVCGGFPNDVYYKAYTDLINVLTVLEVDITKEDATEYTNDYINKIVCTYIQSNEEYISSYGFVDPRIMEAIKAENLFSVIKRVTSSDYSAPSKITPEMLADNIVANCERFKYKYENWWQDRPKVVNRFLEFYSKYANAPKIFTLRNFDIDRGFLKTRDGVFFTIDASNICGTKVRAMLSVTGFLFIVEEFEFTLRYIPMDKAIEYFKAGVCNGWETVSL